MFKLFLTIIATIASFSALAQDETTLSQVNYKGDRVYKNGTPFTGILYSDQTANNSCHCTLEANYNNGYLQGTKKEWYSNGKLKFIGNYINGKLIGEAIKYDLDGNLINNTTKIIDKDYKVAEKAGLFKKITFEPKKCPEKYDSFQVGEKSMNIFFIHQLLNFDESTRVALKGGNSPGNESTMASQMTIDALKKFQIKNDIKPSGLVDSETSDALIRVCQQREKKIAEEKNNKLQNKMIFIGAWVDENTNLVYQFFNNYEGKHQTLSGEYKSFNWNINTKYKIGSIRYSSLEVDTYTLINSGNNRLVLKNVRTREVLRLKRILQ